MFPAFKFLSVTLWIGAVFGIIGTLHSMIWSVSELFTSVLQKTKSKFIHNLMDKGIWNSKISVILSVIIILLMSFIAEGEKLISLSIFVLLPSYSLSVAALLFEKKEWKSGRNAIALFALLGSIVMIYFSLQNVIEMF